MKKNLIESLLLINMMILFQGLFGQVTTFNEEIVLNDPAMQESFYGVTEIGNSYFLLGFTDLGEWNSRLVITSVDNSGAVNWIKLYNIADNQSMYPGNRNAIIKTSDNCIAMTVAYKDAQYENRRTMLIKADTLGNILWSNVLDDSLYTDKDSPAVGLIETNDQGFAVLGQVQIMGILYKTDASGEVEWYETFGNGTTDNYVYLSSIEQTPDSGFIVGASNFMGGVQTSGYARIYKVGKTGNSTWFCNIDGPFRDSEAWVKIISDSTWLAVCSYTLEAAGIYPIRQIFCVHGYDFNGNFIWEKFMGDPDDPYTINSLNRMDDGTLLLSGTDLYHTKSWLFNFSDEGDSLFYREYSHPSKWDTMQRIIDARPTYDGGIITCGEFGYPIGSNYIDNAWILKTDRYGCMEMGCDSMGLYIISQPDTITVCRYDETYLTFETMGYASSYQWQWKYNETWVNISDNLVFEGTNSDTLHIKTSILILPFYQFRCIIENEFYKIESQPIVLEQINAPGIITDPKNFSTEPGYPAIFTVEATGTHPLNYQWYKDDSLIDNANDSLYIIFSVVFSDSGYYHCVISNECDSVESEKAQLQIINLEVDQMKARTRITLRPNPVSNILYIDNKPPGFIKCIIRDICSNMSFTVKTAENKINISQLKPGVYIIELKNNKNEPVYINKIVKK